MYINAKFSNHKCYADRISKEQVLEQVFLFVGASYFMKGIWKNVLNAHITHRINFTKIVDF